MILSHSSGEGINYFHFSSCCLEYIMFDMYEVDKCMLHLPEETKIICFCWGEWFTLTSADGMQSSLFDGCVHWEACVGGAGQQGKTLDCWPGFLPLICLSPPPFLSPVSHHWQRSEAAQLMGKLLPEPPRLAILLIDQMCIVLPWKSWNYLIWFDLI